MGNFVHLHNHSVFSFLDGAIGVEDLARRAKELDMPAVALTDHGGMYGVVKFAQACAKHGVKPVYGCEVYVTENAREKDKNEDQFHLVLLVKDQQGYKNLTSLVSQAHTEHFYYKPRVDKDLLRDHSQGLIALSACLAGEIPRWIQRGEHSKAREAAEQYKGIFGNRFYLELQDHGIPDQAEVNRELFRIGEEKGIELVAANDCHYLHQEDWETQDLLLAIQTNKKLSDSSRLQFETKEFYFKTEEEMAQLFPRETLNNTAKIAEAVEFDLQLGQNLLPEFQPPRNLSSEEYLRKLCWNGLKKRFGTPSREQQERLERELKVIEKMGYADYFLIVWDFIREARRRSIAVGPGRGSAAGSLVSYCLGITEVDPLKYDLVFERFLNPERLNMPDIDIDFSDIRREEIIEYTREKYGEDKVAHIMTVGSIGSKMAIRDTGRIAEYPYEAYDFLSKSIPSGETIEDAKQSNPEFDAAAQKHPDLIKKASFIENTPRHPGVHAGGVVISPRRLDELVPLRLSEGKVTAQLDMEDLEELGLLKMDFLGLRTLTTIEKALEMIEANHGEKVNPQEISYDRATYEMISRGDTAGVFQLESAGMRNTLRRVQPSRFEDIIACVALYRPGPMEQIPRYVKRKHGEEEIEYPHPDLEEILKETYGIIVYQEQIINIAVKMAGFSFGEADVLRKAVGKKKEKLLKEQREKFVKGVEERYSRQLGEELFDLILKFAEYGFNKAHAASYATVAYWTAYLKCHWPKEFMAATLSGCQNSDKVQNYVSEARAMGIEVLPPCVNKSGEDFLVEGNSVRFGLAHIKNVGKAAKTVVENAPYQGLLDFCSRVNLTTCNKKVVESMVKTGAMDSIVKSRESALEIAEKAVKKGRKAQKSSKQMQLFESAPELEEPERTDSLLENLTRERELTGCYLSGHPLDNYREQIRALQKTGSLKSFSQVSSGERATVAAVITSDKRITTKNKERMAILHAEDRTEKAKVVVFPKTYQKYRGNLGEGSVVLLDLKADLDDEGEIEYFAEAVVKFPNNPERVVVDVTEISPHQREKVKNWLLNTPGNIPVYIRENGSKNILPPGFWTSLEYLDQYNLGASVRVVSK